MTTTLVESYVRTAHAIMVTADMCHEGKTVRRWQMPRSHQRTHTYTAAMGIETSTVELMLPHCSNKKQ